MTNTEQRFTELILGLAFLTQEHARWTTSYPPGLIRAQNHLALLMGADFPKTFTAFLKVCQKPLKDWYPGASSLTNFTPEYSLLAGEQLSEQASDYLYSLPDDLVAEHQRRGYVPASVLDNWEMQQLIQHLHSMDDAIEAQRLYVTLRCFLIEHSWITRRDWNTLRRQNIPDEYREILRTKFYTQEETTTEFYVCDRCGILQTVDGQLIGVKPAWCGNHRSGLPYIHKETANEYARLKRGIHLRTFIPGQTEREVFQKAEEYLHEFDGHLTQVERYPGLDAYDLRLTFRDGEVWAVDVKDIADPYLLAQKIQPLRYGGKLRHDHGWYVVPTRRTQLQPDYMELARQAATLKRGMHLATTTDFYAKLRAKCASLVKASR